MCKVVLVLLPLFQDEKQTLAFRDRSNTLIKSDWNIKVIHNVMNLIVKQRLLVKE